MCFNYRLFIRLNRNRCLFANSGDTEIVSTRTVWREGGEELIISIEWTVDLTEGVAERLVVTVSTSQLGYSFGFKNSYFVLLFLFLFYIITFLTCNSLNIEIIERLLLLQRMTICHLLKMN